MADAETLEAATHTEPGDAPDTEARARAQGWRPREEFKGPAERWRPADEFLKASETFMPVAIERNRALEKKLDGQTKEISELKQVMSDFRDFASKAEARAYEKARSELQAKRDVAVAHADVDTFRQTERELAELDKQATPKRDEARRDASATPRVDPVIEGWISENKWFNSDRILHDFAKSVDADLERSRPGLDLSERLSAVRAEVQRRFPEKFENPSRDAATAVSAPSGATPRKTNKKSYDNLPPEAKKACDKFVKSIPGFKADDYVRDYDWGFE